MTETAVNTPAAPELSIYKQMVQDDISAVFFNLDELADYRNVGGKQMPVIQDDNRILDRSDLAAMGSGIGEGLIFVREEDFVRIPEPTELLPIDGKNWFIVSLINNKGVFEIRLSRTKRQPEHTPTNPMVGNYGD